MSNWMNMHLSRAAWAMDCEVDTGAFNRLFAAGGQGKVAAVALLSAASALVSAEFIKDRLEPTLEAIDAGEDQRTEALVDVLTVYDARRAAAIEALTAIKPALVEASVFKEIALKP